MWIKGLLQKPQATLCCWNGTQVLDWNSVTAQIPHPRGWEAAGTSDNKMLPALSQTPERANIISPLTVSILERNVATWLRFRTVQLHSLELKMRGEIVVFIKRNAFSDNKKINLNSEIWGLTSLLISYITPRKLSWGDGFCSYHTFDKK